MGARKVDYEVVRNLYLSGLSCIKISKILKVARTTIQQITHKLGISDPERLSKPKIPLQVLIEEYKKGLGAYRIGKKYGVNMRSVSKRLKRLKIVNSNRQCKKKLGSRRSRRTHAHEFKDSTKKYRFFQEKGYCEICKKLIGNGLNWMLATYHHRKLVANGGDADLNNCEVLHTECHKKHFYELHGFDYQKLNNYKKIKNKKRKFKEINKELFVDLYVNKNVKTKEISRLMKINYYRLKDFLTRLVKNEEISKEFVINKRIQENSKMSDKDILDRLTMKTSDIAKELKVTERAVYYRIRRLSRPGGCGGLKIHRIRFDSERRHFIELKCAFCGNMFKRDVRNTNTKIKKGQKDFYCNRSCMAKHFGQGRPKRRAGRVV